MTTQSDDPGVRPRSRSGNRSGVVLGSVALVVALVSVGVAGYQALQVRALQDQTALMDSQVAGLQGDLGDATSRLAKVNDSLTLTRDELTAVGDGLEEVGGQVAEVQEAAFNPKEITKAALPSVLTVYCGDAQGSGFVVDVGEPPEGYASAVMTNHHVVEACTYQDGPEVEVRKGDSTPGAMLYSWDEDNDLALLYIRTKMPALDTAESPAVGDEVVAIGSPYGLDDTVTTG